MLEANYEGTQLDDDEDDPDDRDDYDPFWHKPPVWPRDEHRSNPDKLYSSSRGGFITYTNNYLPLFLIIPPVSSEHYKPGHLRARFGTNFSSVYQQHDENGYKLNADYEITEVFALVDYQLTEKVQLSAFLRGFHYQAGRVDGDLNNFHETLGLETGKRGNAKSDQYSNTFSKDGQTIHKTKKNRLGMGDSVFMVKLKALDESKDLPAISVIVALKAPTADKSLGYDSGSWDPGLGVALTKQVTRSLKAHFNVGVVEPGHSPKFDHLKTTYSSMFALEYFLSKWVSLVLQTQYNTSPFDYDFKGVSEASWTAGVGLHIRLPKDIIVQVHFSDELKNQRDTDYIFGLSVLIDLWAILDLYEDEDPHGH